MANSAHHHYRSAGPHARQVPGPTGRRPVPTSPFPWLWLATALVALARGLLGFGALGRPAAGVALGAASAASQQALAAWRRRARIGRD